MADLEELKNQKEEPFYDREEALSFFWEVIKMILVSLVIIVPIRYFVMQPFFVRGASMEQSFHNGDYVLIDEVTYRFRPPQRGEAIVFRFPQDPSQFFIKRIIGLPGEEVQVRNNEVTIFSEDHPGGLVLKETDYLAKKERTVGDFKIKLEDNEYFVLGDNRQHSSDSRTWGAVSKRLISGRVIFRAWPFNKFGMVQGAEY